MQLKLITAIAVLLLVVASILVAGCTTSNTNQTPSAMPSTNSSTTISATTTAPTTTAATTSPTVAPSPSASPTATTPTPSAMIATSIQFVSDPNVAKGTSMGINVLASGIRICGHGTVSATIGAVSSGGSDCFYTAYLDTSSLNPGTYDVILKFAGDSCYQPSQIQSKITITA